MQVKINLDGALKKLSKDNIQKGRYAVANQALADMAPYVPKDEGVLRMSATIDADGKAINYNTPYARRRFYEPAKNYTTPGTGPRRDLKAESLHMKDWERAFLKGADLD